MSGIISCEFGKTINNDGRIETEVYRSGLRVKVPAVVGKVTGIKYDGETVLATTVQEEGKPIMRLPQFGIEK